jgi:ParB-like chromosome segregation protein Spo0J
VAHERAYDFRVVPISELHPFDRNPRKITERGVAKIAGSIERFGFIAPVIAQMNTGVVIAGHQRLRAAAEAGDTTAPVLFVDLDDDEAIAYNIADNRLAEEATWDDELLRPLLEGIDEELRSRLGFEAEELRRRLSYGDETPADPELQQSGFAIIIDQLTEQGQAELLARFDAEGISARPLMT